MIAAVSTVYNEADIVGATVSHLLDQGVDHVYIADGMSTDGTRDALALARVTVIDDTEPYHLQPRWINYLAGLAAEDGHDWIIPFDADEYWYATDGSTIGEALARCDARVVAARMFQQLDWKTRCIDPQPLPKVAYRWSPDAHVANGNHSVTIAAPAAEGVLDIREFKYRSFAHFKRKIIERNARIDPSLPVTDGWHHRILDGLSEEELRSAWDSMQQVPRVFDPCPSSCLPSTVGS